MFKLFLFLILTTSSLFAQYCGKDSGLACPAPDVDGDGYTTDGSLLGYDCNDSDYQQYPGVWRNVSGYYSKCQTDGTWTTGTLTPNAATGSGANYFVNCNLPTNGTGTFASPWNTLQMVSSLGWAAKPAGWHNPTAGDAIWIAGQCNELIDRDGEVGGEKYSFFILGRNGNSTNRIKVLQWPGMAQAHMRNASEYVSKCVNIESSDYVEFSGIEISGLCDYGLHFATSSYPLIENVYIHDIDGVANNNNSGLAFTTVSNATVRSSFFLNNYDRQHLSAYNNRNIVAFQGTGNKFIYNVLKYTNSEITTGDFHTRNIGYKHGDTTTTTASTATFANNILIGAEVGIETGEAGSWIHSNYDTSTFRFADQRDVGGPFYPNNLLVEYNTSRAKILFEVNNDSADSTASGNIVRNNVLLSNVASYNSETGAIVDTVYGSNSLYDTVSNTSAFDYRTNCYYNSGVGTMVFNHFNHVGSGSKGAQYFFAGWQAADTSGSNNKPAWDDDSFYENPLLNSISNATSSNCANKGYLAGLTGGGSPIVSPTPTPSPTPSSTPVGGIADFIKRVPYIGWGY